MTLHKKIQMEKNHV